MAETKDIIGLIISIFSLIIPVIFLVITSPEEIGIAALVIFGIIAITILILSFLTIIYKKWGEFVSTVNENKRDIMEIKKSLNTNTLISDMGVRLGVLEHLISKKKRGQIDPRIIAWILLLILLFLFLKSIGFF